MTRMPFEILCDNKSSFQIVAVGGSNFRPEYGKPAILVRCDRLDHEDNERGLKLANIILDQLNQLPIEEIRNLLADEMIPVNFGRD